MRWLRRSVVVAMGLVGAVPVGLLAVYTAWMFSNKDDIAPQPRPAVLQLSAPTLPDQRNAFFALIGLSAEAGRDADTVGHALWQINRARAAIPQQERVAAKGFEELNRQDAAAAGEHTPAVSGAPLFCKDATRVCVAEWLAEPRVLAAQRQQLAVQGARCDALWAPGMGFEERLTSPLNFAVNMAPHVRGATLCSRWWRSGAVLAWQQGQPRRAVALLVQASRLDAALLAASQSLISNMVAVSMARDTQATVVGLALRDPSLALQLAPLLGPTPEAALSAAVKRWIATEAAFQQTATDEWAECVDPASAPAQPPVGWAERQLQRVEQWQCRNRIGFLPERNKALFDAYWAGVAAALDGGLPAAIAHLDRQSALAEQRGWHWRNTIGHLLHVVALPAYVEHIRKAADLPLHTEAAALAVAASAQQVPPAERAAWAQRQPMSATLRERLRWDESGQGFTVRTWLEEGQKTPIDPRQAIRFAWPASTPG